MGAPPLTRNALHALSGEQLPCLSEAYNGGRDRDRTCDPYHVKVALSGPRYSAGFGQEIAQLARPRRQVLAIDDQVWLFGWSQGMKVWAAFLKRPENQWDGFCPNVLLSH
jgi:hypothetical protein